MTDDVLTRPDLDYTEFHGMLTVAPEMREFFELLQRVARTDASVLIRGETGTGKELAAKGLHDMSPRSDGPFKALNCATLTKELLASELFGHVKGAFTGAIRDRDGLFKLADKGTIFLDEIAEMPLDIQARLLRVLQEQKFVPLGGTETLDVDVRLLSATHQSLRDAVDGGNFREDLMYRIRVVPLFLPPLRERQGDIEALAWHFIDQQNEKGFRRVTGIEPRAMEAMRRYDWPGNVRELRNVIEYAFAIGTDEVLSVDELTPELRGEPPPKHSTEPKTERELERERLIEALRDADGKKTEAAEILGISRTTLWRKLREHEISDW
jgi:two-component system response regulator AtoC